MTKAQLEAQVAALQAELAADKPNAGLFRTIWNALIGWAQVAELSSKPAKTAMGTVNTIMVKTDDVVNAGANALTKELNAL